MFSPRNSILFTVLALALAVPGQALGQATSTVTSFVVPVVDLPVSNLCTGEVVYMTGSYHHVLITVVKPPGILLISHVNPQNLQGATVEGDRYVAGGSATIVANVSPGAQTLSYPTQLVLAGPGPGTSHSASAAPHHDQCQRRDHGEYRRGDNHLPRVSLLPLMESHAAGVDLQA